MAHRSFVTSRRFLFPASALLAAWLVIERTPLVAQSPPAPDPKAAAALDRGEAAIKAKKWEGALDAFKQAHTLLDKTSTAALFGMSRAYHGLGAYKTEAATCLEALKYVGTNQAMEATLRNQRGMALFSLAEKNTDKELKDAEAEFRAALPLPGAAAIIRYNLGVTLLRQGRDQEGLDLLHAFVDANVRAPEIDVAKRMIDNPRRARENFAPDFSLTTRAGEFMTGRDLVGKTVLLDFWGTWCGPCRAATPDLVGLYKKLAGDKFVMIGISSDSAGDKQVWMDYIDENKMLWPQNLDTTRAVHRAFSVDAFPTYVVIDAEGIIRMRLTGYSSSITRQRLDSEIKKSMKANK